jgi:hypothetical protein
MTSDLHGRDQAAQGGDSNSRVFLRDRFDDAIDAGDDAAIASLLFDRQAYAGITVDSRRALARVAIACLNPRRQRRPPIEEVGGDDTIGLAAGTYRALELFFMVILTVILSSFHPYLSMSPPHQSTRRPFLRSDLQVLALLLEVGGLEGSQQAPPASPAPRHERECQVRSWKAE